MTKSNESLLLSFYGFGVCVRSSDAEIIDNIRRDFSFFIEPQAEFEILLQVFSEAPDYHSLPKLEPSLHSPRNFCYRNADALFIDYFGKGLTIVDLKKKEYKVYSSDPFLRHEIVFLTILALVGENFDKRNIHRIHGLGLVIKGHTVLILLPQGGGKTTLMLELLKEEGVKLVSEDSPLMAPSGEILPFPIRIGIDAQNYKYNFPERYLRLIKRMEFGPKYLLDIGYFENRIASNSSKPDFVFKGVRCLGDDSRILAISKLEMLGVFIENAVIGLGLYQGIEFLIKSNPAELIKKSLIFASRLNNSWKVVSKSKTYKFDFGSDVRKNCETLLKFIS